MLKLGFFKKTTVLTDGTASNITLSASNLIGGLILRDCGGAGRTDVTDTASNIVSAIPGCINGSSFEFYIKNTSDAAEAIQLNGGTNVTVVGTNTIAQDNTKKFLAVVTDASSAAVTIYSLGISVH
jgi:hypothetical protein